MESTMTFGDMEQRVREFMLDTEDPYRFKPCLILSAIIDGIRTLHQRRPESRYIGLKLTDFEYPYLTNESVETDPTQVETVRAMPFHLDKRWEQAIRYFACARCFEFDSSDTINLQRASDCMNSFSALAMQ